VTGCSRFEEEALDRLEHGEPLDAHFETCPDCRAARAAYETLRRGLAETDAPPEPPAGWQARVWARIDSGAPRTRRSWGRWLAPAAGLAAAAGLAVAVWRPEPRPPGLDVSVESAMGAVRRSLEAQPGDRITLAASTGGRPQFELRVYRNDRSLLLRCSREPPCAVRRDEVRATLSLEERGSYQTLLVVSQQPIPEPRGEFDADAGAALDAGAEVVPGQEIQVR
jgi:hypothetical protein